MTYSNFDSVNSRVARAIDKAPHINDAILTNGDVPGYMISRIKDVIYGCKECGLDITYAKLGVHEDYFGSIVIPSSIDNVQIRLFRPRITSEKITPQRFSLELGAVDKHLQHYSIETAGLCFSNAVSREYFHARWTFEIIDKMKAAVADAAARRI